MNRAKCLLAVAGALLLPVAATPPDARAAAPAPSGTDHIYVAGMLSDEIAGVDVSADAPTRRIPGSTATGFGTLAFAASPDGRHLYVAPAASSKLLVFSIGAGGRLAPVPGGQVPVPGQPTGMAFSRDGRHLFVTAAVNLVEGGSVVAYTVGSDAIPVPQGEPASVKEPLDGVGMPAVSPDGRNVYVASYLGNAIYRYSVGGDGAVSGPVERVPGDGSPVSPAVSPDGRHLYTANEFGGDVSGYTIAADGSLAPVPGSPFEAGTVPHGITFTRDGRYAYVPNVFGNEIDGYAVAADGALEPLPGSPYPCGQPGSFPGRALVSSDGARLYVVDVLTTAKVYGFDIGAGGRLAARSEAPFDTGIGISDGPASVLVPASSG